MNTNIQRKQKKAKKKLYKTRLRKSNKNDLNRKVNDFFANEVVEESPDYEFPFNIMPDIQDRFREEGAEEITGISNSNENQMRLIIGIFSFS